MLVQDSFVYMLASKMYYESLDRYQFDEGDFIEPIRRIVPADWQLKRKNVWVHCNPPHLALPQQGWKIHLSATLANAAAVLTTAARLLIPQGVPFKFLLDKSVVLFSNSKRWARGGAGKFVTIYPTNTAHCGQLLESLYQAMIGYQGPYILSDRRYRDSGIVYYRYGGIHPTQRLDVSGTPVAVMQASDGEFVDDERAPYFRLPADMQDPFAREQTPPGQAEAGTLKEGRYQIRSVITFSNPGGVYVATDRRSDKQVIIKEARPYTNVSPRGTDAVWLLKKEHRLLQILESEGIAPRPLDFFKDWEHYYLVEEFLPGRILRGYLADTSLTLRTRPTLADAEEFFTRYRKLFARIAEVLAQLHAHGIVFSDLSHYNVMVMDGGEDIRLFDFEGAYEQGVDIATLLYTPGFAPKEMLDAGSAAVEDDYYALGSLMMAGLIPINSLLVQDPLAYERFLVATIRDFGVAPDIADCIRGALATERSRRLRPALVAEVLRRAPPATSVPEVGSYEADIEDWPRLVESILAYIESAADFSREDRLFPADPMVFDTNPLSVAYGACGVALVLQRITGTVPTPVMDWILHHQLRAETCPPGLYVGLSGVAWTLLELGLTRKALEVLCLTRGHHLLWRSPDLFYGAAGWGMTQLRFFLATADESYLTAAQQAGEFLLQARQEDEGRYWWPAQGEISCGLAHGVSGVSLFLLYLYCATGNEEWLRAGQRGLEFVLSRALRNPDGGATWRAREGAPTYTPYWRWGSAGVGMVLLRYWKVLGDANYASTLSDLLIDTERKYTIFPGWFFGQAGMGEFYLDLAELGWNEEESLRAARKVLAGLLLFRLEREEGLAFPGESLTRISCDFGTGSAGVAHFIHRLASRGAPLFMLDELLESSNIPHQDIRP